MKKLVVSFIALVCFVLGIGAIYAQAETYTGSCGADVTYVLDTDAGVLTISGTGAMDDYEKAKTPWTRQGYYIKTVVIEAGITSIGSNAFYIYSGRLKSVTIPESVTHIGSNAFADSYYLEDVYYKGDLASWTGIEFADSYANPKHLGDNLYINGELLTSELVIPGDVTSIGNYAFSGCTGLTSVTIFDGVTSIGNYAFSGCTRLTSITISQSVTSIGSYAFKDCYFLTQINWNAKSVEDFTESTHAFSNAGKTKDGIKLVFGESVEKIPAYCFCSSAVSKITSVTIGAGVTSIGEYAFEKCIYLTEAVYLGNEDNLTIGSKNTPLTNVICFSKGNCGENCSWKLDYETGKLEINGTGKMEDFWSIKYVPWYNNNAIVKTVVIADGVTSIGGYAFYNCSNLTEIIIPASVTKINRSVFYNCSSLTGVYYEGDLTSWMGIEFLDSPANPMCCTDNVYFSGELLTGELIIPDGIISIGNYVFSGWAGLESVTISDSVTEIGDYAFFDCTGLISITIPDSVTSMGYWAFYNTGYYNDTNNWENNVLYINNHLIAANTLIEGECEIKDGTVTIVAYGFNECANLTGVVIPDSVKIIGKNAFCGCKNLTKVTIGEGVKRIYNSAFFQCMGLTEINWNAKNVEDFASYNSIFVCAGQSREGIKVTFGDGVERIPAFCFYPYENSSYTPKITSITIGESVTSIGIKAFYNCTDLTEIIWNAPSVEDFSSSSAIFTYAGQSGEGIRVVFRDGIERIPAHCFYVSGNSSYAPKISKVLIPDSVTSIGKYAFYNCTELTGVTIPDSVTSIGDSALCNTGYYNDANNWENDALYIGKHLIKANVQLQGEYKIKDGTVTIADYALKGCNSLTSVTIPTSMTNIGNHAFYNCNSLTDVYYEGDLTDWLKLYSYDYYANPMYYASNLYINNELLTGELVIPDGVTIIGHCAFKGCSGLTSVTIPDSVTSIGAYAFYNCSGLTDALYLGNYEDLEVESYNWDLTNVLRYIKGRCGADCDWSLDYTTGTLTISGTGQMENYWSTPWHNSRDDIKNVVIKEGVTSIGSSAFERCRNVTSVTIPDSLKSIGRSAFYGCAGLTSVIIGKNVVSIDICAFDNCTGLTNVTIPDSVMILEEGAFSGCTGLISATIGEGVTTMGENVFDGCTILKEIIVNENNKYFSSIDGVLFDIDKTHLIRYPQAKPDKIYAIPETVASIEEKAFQNCSSLTELKIPDSVTSMGDFTFYNCSGLTSVSIGNGLTRIGASAFTGCTGLTSIIIPNSVISIDEYAFDNCTGLTSVIIGESVTNIEDCAFIECSSLEDAVCFGVKENLTIGLGNSCLTNVLRYVNDINVIINSDTLTVVPKKVEKGDVILALVVEDGVANVYACEYTGNGNVTFNVGSSVDNIKVMLWKSYTSLQPVIDAIIMK